MRLAMPELLPALAARRARRAFDTGPVPEDVQEVLWQAVSVAPSHGNSQATRILLAESAGTRERLAGALGEGNLSWATAAPLLLAIASIPAHEGRPKDRDGNERELWAFNSGIATGNLLAQATALGLVAHPMAGFDEPAAREAFGAPAGVRVLVIVAIGTRAIPAASRPSSSNARRPRRSGCPSPSWLRETAGLTRTGRATGSIANALPARPPEPAAA